MWFVMEQAQEKYRLSDRLIRAITSWPLNEIEEDEILALIENGADVNHRHGTLLPLQCACMVGDSVILRLLIEKGAKVNEIDGYERSALHYAAERDPICVGILLQNGANINQGDGNMDTPLHWASYKNSVKCVKLLLEMGASVNAVDYNNDTPISWAARKGNLHVTRILLDYNADTDIKNRAGQTALQRAAAIQASGLNTEQDDATLDFLIKASGQFVLLNENCQPFSIIAKDKRLNDLMRPLCQNARTLLHLCRKEIRKCIGTQFLPEVIPTLPLPCKLHEFLLLRENLENLCCFDDNYVRRYPGLWVDD